MKKVKFILIAVLFCVLFISLRGTYAKYANAIDKKVKLSIANWIIKVNSKDITLVADHQFSISKLEVSRTAYPNVNGKLAPGTEGTFTIALDATESSVSLEYDLSISLDSIPNDKIIVKEVSADKGTLRKIIDYEYHGVVDLDTVKNNVILITATIKWIDDENNTEADNNLGRVADNELSIPVTITVNQLIE